MIMNEEELNQETAKIKASYDIPSMAKEMDQFVNELQASGESNISFPKLFQHWNSKGFELPQDLHTLLALVDICRYHNQTKQS